MVANDGLKTNEKRNRCGLTFSATCSLCNSHAETSIHLLRDCVNIQPIWQQLHFSHFTHTTDMDVHDWLHKNLKPSMAAGSTDRHVIFGVAVWCIWLGRNQQVFDGKQFQTQRVINQIRALAADIQRIGQEAPHMGQQYQKVEVGWKPPIAGWIKCNSDGALFASSNKAACGELWGMLTTLQLAWDKGFRLVNLESDSMLAVSLVVKGCPPTHPCYSIVALINCLKMRDWQVSVNHIYRQANQVAIWLAGFAIKLPTGIHYLSSPPPGCVPLLWQDVAGIHFSRRVLM
ncbi:ribonuclease H [Trifolium pratense]|uniref:Ribonuclease H n=1 Tax=Trifolium pratense TaxID=57577 RepID=A0A2K3N4Y2_TRIPR|nr:ribonuclease H [Trifolium pratense]